MFQMITRRRRFQFAVDALKAGADIDLSKTPVGAEVRELFYSLNKSSSFSNEASAAVVLRMFSILLVDYVRQHPESGMEVAIPFSRVPEIISMMIHVWEIKAPDRDHYKEVIGDSLSAKFHEAWKRMMEQRETERLAS